MVRPNSHSQIARSMGRANQVLNAYCTVSQYHVSNTCPTESKELQNQSKGTAHGTGMLFWADLLLFLFVMDAAVSHWQCFFFSVFVVQGKFKKPGPNPCRKQFEKLFIAMERTNSNYMLMWYVFPKTYTIEEKKKCLIQTFFFLYSLQARSQRAGQVHGGTFTEKDGRPREKVDHVHVVKVFGSRSTLNFVGLVQSVS